MIFFTTIVRNKFTRLFNMCHYTVKTEIQSQPKYFFSVLVLCTQVNNMFAMLL